jgi:cytoplasmic iron level regulating protein YaaA (DUF328/UPF0246 family)
MPALATQRLIVPISPADKEKVEKKASARHMSTAEFVRRAILRDDLLDEERQQEAELRALLEVFAVTHAETIEQLDRTDRALDKALAYFAAKEGR